MVEKTFPADDRALVDINAFVEEELDKVECPLKIAMQIFVCIEEIFVNIAHYAYKQDPGCMTLGISEDDGIISFVFTDSGIPFDPLAVEDPDITLGADERDIGGLGIFMVKKSMDDVQYERKDDKNIFIMKKRIR